MTFPVKVSRFSKRMRHPAHNSIQRTRFHTDKRFLALFIKITMSFSYRKSWATLRKLSRTNGQACRWKKRSLKVKKNIKLNDQINKKLTKLSICYCKSLRTRADVFRSLVYIFAFKILSIKWNYLLFLSMLFQQLMRDQDWKLIKRE